MMAAPRLRRLAALLALLTLTSACSITPSLGIRPPEPTFASADSCTQLRGYLDYAAQLREAYHSRATQNRWWIYVAGTLGLATVAASAGLAAAAASTVTIALLAVSGGATSTFFAFLGNDGLAQIYTDAANDVDKAMREAAAVAVNANATTGECSDAYAALTDAIGRASRELEQDRTTSAVNAQARARELKKELEVSQTQMALQPASSMAITDVTPAEINPAVSRAVTITVAGVNLDTIQLQDLRVQLGSAPPVRVDSVTASRGAAGTYRLTFTAPAVPPPPVPAAGYPLTLIVRDRVMIRSSADAPLLKYKP
jgi:hypothetical protein